MPWHGSNSGAADGPVEAGAAVFSAVAVAAVLVGVIFMCGFWKRKREQRQQVRIVTVAQQ